MKFLKNKVVQALSVTLAVATIGVVVYTSNDNTVHTDSNATIEYVNQYVDNAIAELQTQIDTLNTTITEQTTEIESLKTENTNLKADIKDCDNDIKDLNSKIATANSKISSINAREDYLFTKGATGLHLNIISRYINENLRYYPCSFLYKEGGSLC